jgi:hypothetical protein
MKTLRLLSSVLRLLSCVLLFVSGLPFAVFFSFSRSDAAVDAGTLVGKVSSRKVCQMMLGGLEMMLNRANLRMGARLREKGVCGAWVLVARACRWTVKGTCVFLVGREKLRQDVGDDAYRRALRRLGNHS